MAKPVKEVYKNEFGPARLTPAEVKAEIKRRRVKRNEIVAQNARSRGFTLMELMIVVAIIGIIASVALPMFKGKKVDDQDQAVKQTQEESMRAKGFERK